MAELSPRTEAFISRINASSDKSTAMSHLSGWMVKNLRLNGRPYSFKHHEMQIDIASDQHPHKAVEKCSQVGMTELALRLVAAIAGVTRSRIIYVLPSARFSEKVSTDRFYPIIHESPILAAMVHSEAKSAAMRKLGNSTVYFQGASGTSQAISIPASHLVFDEENFCDPEVLGQFNSRLRHAEEDPATGIRGVRNRFSTPTIPNYGVSKHYELSDKKTYHVKCKSCNTWQVPSYYKDYIVPGYDGEIALFEASDLYNPKYKIEEAYVKCQCCGNNLWSSLMDPDCRQWVAEFPEIKDLSGYRVAPIDVPYYNKVPSIFKQLEGYTLQDHRNFVVGLPHEDKNNSFLMSIFDRMDKAKFITIEEARLLTLSGIRIGVDIGKISHLVVGQKTSNKDIRIIHLAELVSSPGVTIAMLVQRYIDAFKPEMTVVDAGPDFSTSQTLIADNAYATVYGCEYKRSVSESYSYIDLRDEDGVVRADRSGTLSTFMEQHNKGHIKYPAHEETAVMKEHLKVTKKITRKGDFGNVVLFPKPSSPDHYAHAGNYMMIADAAVDKEDYLGGAVGVLPGVTAVTVGVNSKP
jgi:hypothetical protein